ncbi:unnamed protein product [Lactuca saligna]|uniref:Uncharacterized protein n=1 Tax=Lactuca saligna TaxID=75948 RepID=A0AA35ZU42_LACSI|nr:unnamed protein product [Lactuca saligna]
MASTSHTKKPKRPKLPEKTYLPDSDSDDDAFDFSFLDFSDKTFKAPSKLYDGDIPGVQQNDHAYLDEDDKDVGVEYRVYDPNVEWKEMRPRLGDCYESPAQLRNYHFGSLVTSNWLAKHYLKDVIMKPKMTLLEMQVDVLQRFLVSVYVGQWQREKATAMGMIERKLEDHYVRVWDYTTAIKLSNPGTTCLVGVESNPGCNYFKRFYVGYKDFRDGRNKGCRRVI